MQGQRNAFLRSNRWRVALSVLLHGETMTPDEQIKKALEEARLFREASDDAIHNRALKMGREMMRDACKEGTHALTKTMLALVWASSYHAGAIFQDEAHDLTRKLLVDAVDTGLRKGREFRERIMRGEDTDG